MATKKLSQNEKIRRLFVNKGLTRSQIASRLGVAYQVVFKATSVQYASKGWVERLEAAHAAREAAANRAVEAAAEA